MEEKEVTTPIPYSTRKLTVGDWKEVGAVSISSSLSLLLLPFSLFFVLSAFSSCFCNRLSASSSAVLMAIGSVRPASPSKSSFLVMVKI
jgi:hypothetical protein